MTHSDDQLQSAICQALYLQSSAAWSSLERLRTTFHGLDPSPSIALLNALCNNPMKVLQERKSDLNALSELAPLSACAMSMSRSTMALGQEYMLNGQQPLAENALRQALAYSIEAVAAAGIGVPSVLPDQLFSKVGSMVDAVDSQLELAFDLERQRLPAQLTLVLGMHRSGTSALTGMLVSSGLDGPDDLMPSTFNNPKGYFESISFMQQNDWLLSELSSSWSSTTLIDESFWLNGSDSIKTWRRRVLAMLHDVFRPGSSAILKDPRLCLLLRAITPWLESGLINIYSVLPVRHPLEVVESLHLSEGVARIQGLQLWLRYVLESERYTRGNVRLITSYDELMTRPEAILSSIYQLYSTDPNISSVGTLNISAASAFIEPQLHRQRVSASVPDWILEKEASLFYDMAISIYSMLTNKSLSDGEVYSGMNDAWRQWRLLMGKSF